MSHYDSFYAAGGWTYDPSATRNIIRRHVVGPAGWEPGIRILEIGCGMGLHAALLHESGMRVTAIDRSRVAIEHARGQYKGVEYVCADLATWEPNGLYDGVYCRGMSWFHYELTGVNRQGVDVPKEAQRLFSWINPSGVFVLDIATNFSGWKGGENSPIYDNRLLDYAALFGRFGDMVSVKDWQGRDVSDGLHSNPPSYGIYLHVCKKA